MRPTSTTTTDSDGCPLATTALLAGPSRDASLTLAALWHDLRTPLTVIKGSAQLLARRIQSASANPVGLAEGLTQIERTASRMAIMLDDLHELAQAAAGHRPVLDLRPTDLVELAHRVADEHNLLSGGRAIKVTPETANLVGAWDEGRLERVLANVFANALKYSAAGAPVTVRVGREWGGWARLVVADNGIGIPAEDLPHIFTPFFRGANAAGRTAGSGIGLASVHAIVERHGGTVVVESAAGQGTTVVVRLPLQPPEGM